MSLVDQLTDQVHTIVSSNWTVQSTNSIPDPEDVRLSGNNAKDLDQATVMYADLSGSTAMVDTHPWQHCAEVYQSYLRCAAMIIRDEDGEVTAYDGDRVMAIFSGKNKNTRAVRAAMKINHAVYKIINPQLKSFYGGTAPSVGHAVGIDTGPLKAARIGVRGYNDLVWIGTAANHAAKLTGLKKSADLSKYSLWITKSVYDVMAAPVKIQSSTGEDMWKQFKWTAMNGRLIYASNYTHTI